MENILIIEDDRRLGSSIQKGLTEQDFSVELASDGQSALDVLQKSKPNLIVLDLGLPDYDGIDLMKKIRKLDYNSPILILTARDGLTDKVQGLDLGADDYMVKPFAFVELVARIHALLRRSPSAGKIFKVGDLSIDLLTRHVVKGDQTLDLTPREFDLLAYLAQYAGEIVSRSMIEEHVWRETSRFTSLDNVIDVHVSRLRRKLKSDSDSSPLQVVRGVGIKLENV